jgi:hypothetical protein
MPRQVPAENGFRWIVDAVRLTQANPGPFLLMGLVIGAIAVVPLLGGLALAVFGPTLYAGIVFAAREQSHGRPADFQHLLQGFQQPSKLPRLVMLCLPGIVAGLLVAILAAIFIGGAVAAAGAGAVTGAQTLGAAGMGAGMVFFVLLAIGVGIAAYAAVFFAIPRVMLTDVDAVSAIRDSLSACAENIGAFMLFVVSMIVGVMLLSIVTSLLLGWVSILLAQLVVMSLLVPVFSSALYFAFRDVFGSEAGEPERVEETGIEV